MTCVDKAIQKAESHFGQLTEVASRTKKYRVFESPNRPGKKIFIGKHGAIRIGTNVQNSISLTDTI